MTLTEIRNISIPIEPDGKRTEAVGNIIKGSPTVFSAQTIDNSEGKRFGEINRRSIPITPNTDDNKIRAAIQLMGKKGLLAEEYDRASCK